MKKTRELFEIIILGQKYTVDLDLRNRKNLNIRIKPNNVIKVSKPESMSIYTLIDYLKDQEDWIHQKSLGLNDLQERRENLNTHSHIMIFNKEQSLVDNLSLNDELEAILLEYIEGRRDHYDKLYQVKPTLEVKKMRGKWGYCLFKKEKLVFNVKLVHYPKEVIDYVILHEYTHLKIPNHSKEFYDLIKRDMPEYKKYVKYLKEH